MDQNEIIKLVQKYIMLLNASGIHIDKTFLYGSFARGQATDKSDIDIMLVSELFDKCDDKIRAKAWRLTEKIDIRIEPYTIGLQKYLTDDVSPLLHIVKKEGIEVTL